MKKKTLLICGLAMLCLAGCNGEKQPAEAEQSAEISDAAQPDVEEAQEAAENKALALR